MAVFTSVVRTIADGSPVDAATANAPLSDLAQRTEWLRDQLLAITAGAQLVLRNQTVPLGTVLGEVVYYDDALNTYMPARATYDTTNPTVAAASAFWQGVVVAVSGTGADILIGGTGELAQADWAGAFEGGVFAAGDVFLSSVTAGKLSSVPGCCGIYIGHLRDTGGGDAELLLRLGNPGSYLEHIHVERTLVGDPAGTVIDPAPGDPQLVNTPDPLEQGWLPANVTYFPGYVVGVQIPTGAVFGYNIQHANETALREIFPLVPPDNAQFSQTGLILTSDKVVTNAYGIWWMDNSYGNAPWPVDYAVSGVADPVTLWTARLTASTLLSDLISQAIINRLANGEIDEIAAASIQSSDPDSLGVSGTEGDAITGWRGDILLTNNGVTGVRYGRGLAIAGTAGDNVLGYKGLLDVEFAADISAQHLYTYVDPLNASPTEKQALVTTNGVSAGATIGAYGHRLGAEATDFVDFVVAAGRDLPAAVDYLATVTIQACVDTVAGAPVSGDVDVSFYRLSTNEPVGTTRLQRTTQAAFSTGLPGALQTVVVGPFADVLVQQGDQLLVRITNSAGGSPLTGDTLRIVAVTYRLDPA